MSVPMPSGAPFALSTRILAGSLMGALLFMGVALFTVLPVDETPPLWVFVAQLAAGAALGRTAETLESAGRRSYLREAFGLSGPGSIQRL